jgi:hypothetical protein
VSFSGLRESLQDRGPDKALRASEAILATLLELLVGLLGEELGLRPVYTIWPGLPDGAPPISRKGKA